jgi:hypothetical protein
VQTLNHKNLWWSGMALIRPHYKLYEEIFLLEGFLKDPVLTIGFQDSLIFSKRTKNKKIYQEALTAGAHGRHSALKTSIIESGKKIPKWLVGDDLGQVLSNLGLRQIVTLDKFDDRADLSYDMNLPIPKSEYNRYKTIIDVGCLEHVFDTRQCLENYFKMVDLNGYFLLHTWVKGNFGHGFHTFHPQALVDAFLLNGFEIHYAKFSDMAGRRINSPEDKKAKDVIIWLLGKKTKNITKFRCPQQTFWTGVYKHEKSRQKRRA